MEAGGPARAEPVVVYSQPDCPPCDAVKAFLRARDVEFVVRDVTKDDAALEELRRLGSHSTPTVKVGDRVMIGFRQKELAAMLADRSR